MLRVCRIPIGVRACPPGSNLGLTPRDAEKRGAPVPLLFRTKTKYKNVPKIHIKKNLEESFKKHIFRGFLDNGGMTPHLKCTVMYGVHLSSL
jgi:hypothetical protein